MNEKAKMRLHLMFWILVLWILFTIYYFFFWRLTSLFYFWKICIHHLLKFSERTEFKYVQFETLSNFHLEQFISASMATIVPLDRWVMYDEKNFRKTLNDLTSAITKKIIELIEQLLNDSIPWKLRVSVCCIQHSLWCSTFFKTINWK